MIVTITPTKLCIETREMNEVEEAFLDSYSPPECLVCHWKDSSFEITGKPANLYEVLLYLSYKFDIEIK